MRILDLGKERRARVWIGDHPDSDYPSQRTLSHSVTAGKKPYNQAKVGVVEVLVPLGGRFKYGLLGGILRPAPTDVLSIELNVSSPGERLFINSLAKEIDEVRVGLPEEYAEAVLSGVDVAKEQLNALAPGSLSICYAAHGAVGSSRVIFKHLATILVKILNSECVDLSDAELLKLFPASFG